jgi:hypothetical protein
MGIVTTGCCCGHNKIFAYIGVAWESIEKMKELGYETVNGRMDEFKPISLE